MSNVITNAAKMAAIQAGKMPALRRAAKHAFQI